MFHLLTLAACSLAPMAPADVIVDRDDVRITRDCVVRVSEETIFDVNGNGVIHIVGDDITVAFAEGTHLRGAAPDTLPNDMSGVGIVVTGKNVTLTNLHVSGYKVGLHAHMADGLIISEAHFDDNFRQRLKSNPQREDVADWLSPHDNDNNEWIDRYGASAWIENSNRVSISKVIVRNGQNGIILENVNESRVFDCDCSFLSGWGIAMWRSSDNIICRNALDFCIRGYSHGVYNRGQDSAGLLMFEQCNNNIITGNSITHGGDGVFMFAGREALGESNPRDDLNWYKGRGCSGNIFHNNDLSYAAAHGLECTFSFDNIITLNRFHENAICGIWGGYSQKLRVAQNSFARNGDQGYGLERGGVNIEHGVGNRVFLNVFDGDQCGVHLWWDDDAGLFQTPWYRVNQADNPLAAALIVDNSFSHTPVAIHLRHLRRPVECAINRFSDTDNNIKIEGEHVNVLEPADSHPFVHVDVPHDLPGETRPFGAREDLHGRENIIMTEWGPWDHESPLAHRADDATEPGTHRWRVHGTEGTIRIQQHGGVQALVHKSMNTPPTVTVTSAEPGIHPYEIDFSAGDFKTTLKGVLVDASWDVSFFAWFADPREDVDGWRRESRSAVRTTLPDLRLMYASDGPSDVVEEGEVQNAQLPDNQFGTIATSTLAFPAGRWRIRTVSDDGVRVWLDDAVVIDDWTWHAPREHVHEFTVGESRDISIRVEHFELDGYAVLTLDLEHVSD